MVDSGYPNGYNTRQTTDLKYEPFYEVETYIHIIINTRKQYIVCPLQFLSGLLLAHRTHVLSSSVSIYYHSFIGFSIHIIYKLTRFVLFK